MEVPETADAYYADPARFDGLRKDQAFKLINQAADALKERFVNLEYLEVLEPFDPVEGFRAIVGRSDVGYWVADIRIRPIPREDY